MKYALIIGGSVYAFVTLGVFVLHTQMPVTFGLAVMRAVLWPLWIVGLVKGTPLPMD